MLVWYALGIAGFRGKVRFFCGDETRLGLKTLEERKITKRGIKPKGFVQWKFKATYLYGIVEPKTGEHFFYEFTHLNSDCFQVFLKLISERYAGEIIILQLDNGAFHKAKKLQIPNNIILIFQPPYCPELNPIEQVWQYLKRGLRWRNFQNLDELRKELSNRLESMTKEVIVSITGRKSILQALCVAGI